MLFFSFACPFFCPSLLQVDFDPQLHFLRLFFFSPQFWIAQKLFFFFRPSSKARLLENVNLVQPLTFGVLLPHVFAHGTFEIRRVHVALMVKHLHSAFMMGWLPIDKCLFARQFFFFFFF